MLTNGNEFVLNLLDSIGRGPLIPVRGLPKFFTNEITEVVILNSKRVEDDEHLCIEFLLGQSDARVVTLVILGAAIVHVLSLPALAHLCLPLSRDRRTTVPTLDQIAGVGHLVLIVDLVAEESLNTIPESSLNDRRMSASLHDLISVCIAVCHFRSGYALTPAAHCGKCYSTLALITAGTENGAVQWYAVMPLHGIVFSGMLNGI